MASEPILPAYPECLKAMDEELSVMARRLQDLMSMSSPTQDVFTEIVMIYSNVTYIFKYLEGNRHLNEEPLLWHRDAFFSNRERDEEMLKWLVDLPCPDAQIEAERRRWVTWLQKRVHPSDPELDQRIEGLYTEAKRVLHEVDEVQGTLLRHLGVKTEQASPATVFYRMASTIESATTRSKLALAWRRERDRRLPVLTEIIDGIIAQRRVRARKKGFETVAEETFQRCSVPEPDARKFMRAYLVRSLKSHTQLAAAIGDATGCQDNPMDHFGYYLRTLLKGTKLPLFKFDACLDYLLSVACRVFGLSVSRRSGNHPDSILVTIGVGDTEVGTISFDLLDARYNQAAQEVPLAMDGAPSTESITRPGGHVLCWFQREEDGVRRMTFERIHSLFHGFGHALNHLLLRKRPPNQSGLEYLPLERLENLSMWFEKWVYHPQFADSLSLTSAEREGLFLCQRIMMLEFLSINLENSVTIALDFEVHQRTEGGLAQSFQRLDDEFSIADHIPFGRLPQYFTAPIFRANPGASFGYVWGAADSTEKFAPFMRQRIEAMPVPAQVSATLSGCFDFDEPSIEPDIAAVFDFYSTATWK